jgi:hypothetical protein
LAACTSAREHSGINRQHIAALDARSENVPRKVDEDVREGIRQILTRSPCDYAFSSPTGTVSAANLIERQWLDLHANVTRNHPHSSMIQLMTAVRRYLHRRFYAFRGVCCGC